MVCVIFVSRQSSLWLTGLKAQTNQLASLQWMADTCCFCGGTTTVKMSASCFFPDINECESNQNGCEQLCFNVPGSYSCDCHYGFRLDENRRSCSKGNAFMQCVDYCVYMQKGKRMQYSHSAPWSLTLVGNSANFGKEFCLVLCSYSFYY